MQKSLAHFACHAEIIFWDFDGVIKDSLKVKSRAFEKLFLSYGSQTALKVRLHHEKNEGISRFEKIPLYLSWSNELVTKKKIQEFCNNFSVLVKQSVIESPWIPGVFEWLENNYMNHKFILVTATPKDEIDEILIELNIKHFFYKIYGAPISKREAISFELKFLEVNPESAIMIGDSYNDYIAAKDNKILFLLKRTKLNKGLQKICKEHTFEDFVNE